MYVIGARRMHFSCHCVQLAIRNAVIASRQAWQSQRNAHNGRDMKTFFSWYVFLRKRDICLSASDMQTAGLRCGKIKNTATIRRRRYGIIRIANVCNRRAPYGISHRLYVIRSPSFWAQSKNLFAFKFPHNARQQPCNSRGYKPQFTTATPSIHAVRQFTHEAQLHSPPCNFVFQRYSIR